MSYVFGAAIWNKGVYLVGDKRMCVMKDGLLTPISDEHVKVRRFNDNLIIGFSGEWSEKTKMFDLVQNISDMGVICPAEMASNIVANFDSIRNDKYPEKVDIIVAGIAENGAPAISVINGSNDNQILNGITSPEKQFVYSIIGVGKEIDRDQFLNDLKHLISNPSPSFDAELFARIDQQIALVSENEISVSKETDHLMIKV